MTDKAFDVVRAEPAGDWSIPRLLKVSGLSVTGDRLRQLCQHFYGQSPMRRVTAIRMQVPRELLTSTDYCIYIIAPIVFTIHGGGFKNGSKAYCNQDMQKLFLDKGCVVVSPNYRLLKQGTGTTITDCEIDCAMAVAYIQANAEKYGGDPSRIVSTGGSAGGYLSAQIAYKEKWDRAVCERSRFFGGPVQQARLE